MLVGNWLIFMPIKMDVQNNIVIAAIIIQMFLLFGNFSALFILLTKNIAKGNIEHKKKALTLNPNNKIPAVSERDMPIGIHCRIKTQ